jgi:secreted trypsin-like serine protease
LAQALIAVGLVSYSWACEPLVPLPPPTTTTQAPLAPAPAPTSSGCQCGVANRATRIVNGVTTEENEYPWQIGITSGVGRTPYCGGTIISSKTILTAAHCTQGTSATNMYVLVAEHDLTKADGEKYVRVCAKNEHPNYDSGTTDYDYATLTLCEDLTWAKDVAPACLPTASGSGTEYEFKAAVVSGWGTLTSGGYQPTVLQETTVTTMPNSKCCASDTAYSCTDLTARMMCAAGPNTDSCQGDSGGPLVVQDGASFVIAGVVSWGYGCAQADAPGVYSRVTDQLPWIQNKMAGTTCPR